MQACNGTAAHPVDGAEAAAQQQLAVGLLRQREHAAVGIWDSSYSRVNVPQQARRSLDLHQRVGNAIQHN